MKKVMELLVESAEWEFLWAELDMGQRARETGQS